MPLTASPTTSIKPEPYPAPSASPAGSSASAGWSQAQRSALLNHVVKHGETHWDAAVPGKTAQQSREQWKRRLLPQIKKACGLN
ncbi:hypothetical protein Q5752_005003 [Cryptotrichosporon argae]